MELGGLVGVEAREIFSGSDRGKRIEAVMAPVSLVGVSTRFASWSACAS